MNEGDVIALGQAAFWVVIKIGGPILAAGLLVGVIIALFQALTSIQEMTLTFVPKIVVVFASVTILLPYLIGVLTEFGVLMFDRMIVVG